MAIVKVKQKYQVTLPTAVRERAGIDIGDLLEVKVEKKKITLTPKTAIDKRLAESLADIKAGRVSPAFDNVNDAIKYLEKRIKHYRK